MDLTVGQILTIFKTRTRKRMFLIKWKRFSDYEATWEPLEGLKGATETIREYWNNTYDTPIPFALPDSGPNISGWTSQQPDYVPVSPELDPDGFWQSVQDSDYSDTEEHSFTLDTI